MGRIRAILFDLGDTLVDFGPVDTLRLFTEGAHVAYEYLKGLSQPLPTFDQFRRRQLRAIRWHYLKSRLTRREFNSLDLLGRLAQRMGHELTAEQTLQLAWCWYEPLSRCARVERGLGEMLSEFRSDGIRLGLVSNTFVPGQVLDRHLEQLGLLEHFPVRVYSCDVRFRKPHPEIFQIALDRLDVAASEAAFVGDDLVADVGGARRAGMITVLKDPEGQNRRGRVRPAHRIRSLLELRGIVASYNRPAAAGAG